MQTITGWAEVRGPGLFFWDILGGAPSLAAEHLSSIDRGAISVKALNCLATIPSQRPAAVLTCPIDKYACAQAGFNYPGHTEFCCEKWGNGQGIMILAGPRLKVGLVTNHVAIKDLPAQISADLVCQKLHLLARSLHTCWEIAVPKIAVCGFNPHCSDQGLFGDEEKRCIEPGMAKFRAEMKDNVAVTGPVPADTAFYYAYQGEYDAVLAMYHDQGLGPLKTVHFDEAVNITGGIDIFRVSPDHGPARDHYLKNSASLRSFRAAFDHCLRVLR